MRTRTRLRDPTPSTTGRCGDGGEVHLSPGFGWTEDGLPLADGGVPDGVAQFLRGGDGHERVPLPGWRRLASDRGPPQGGGVMASKHGAPDRWLFCEAHGKRAYEGRRAAKAVIRVLPRAEGMREYRCDAFPDNRWHVGHMPEVVRRGEMSSSEVYRDAS